MEVKKNIRLTIVSYALPPSATPRSYQVSRILNELSNYFKNITVLTADEHLYGNHVDDSLKLNLSKSSIKRINLYRPSTKFGQFFEAKYQNFFRFPDQFNLWAIKCCLVAIKIIRSSDVIFTFSTPVSDHLVGLFSKVLFGKKWIAYFSDPFTNNPYNTYTIFEGFLNKHLQNLIFTKADKIVFTNKYIIEEVRRMHPKIENDKLGFIPHSISGNNKIANKVHNSKLTIRYLGAFYGHRNPLTIFEALSSLQKEIPDLKKHLVFEIYGFKPIQFENWCSKFQLEDIVKHRGPVKLEKGLELMQSADILVNIDSKDDYKLFLSSKVIEYLEANKPILSIGSTLGAAADLVRSLGLTPIDYDDIVGIKHSIKKYLQQKKGKGILYTPPAEILNSYLTRNIVKKYVDYINEV